MIVRNYRSFCLLFIINCLVIFIVLFQRSIYEAFSCFISLSILLFIFVFADYFIFKNFKFTFFVYLLNSLGIFIQILMDVNVKTSLFAILLGFICIGLYKLFMNYSFNYKWFFFLEVLLFVVLFLFGDNVSNTKAWLRIGSYSMQLTEILKVLSVLFYCEMVSIDDKFKISSIFFGIQIIGCLFINELGALLILGILYLVMMYVLLDLNLFIKILIGIVGLCFVGIFIISILIKFELHSISNPILLSLVNIAYKLHTRFMLVVNLDSMDAYGVAYQTNQAMNGIVLGGLFGKPEAFNLPVGMFDYPLICMMIKVGLIYVI